jgi:hypothetical protein
MGTPMGKISRRDHIISSYLFLLSKKYIKLNPSQRSNGALIVIITVLKDIITAP